MNSAGITYKGPWDNKFYWFSYYQVGAMPAPFQHIICLQMRNAETIAQWKIKRYQVADPWRLSSWREIAKAEIKLFITEDGYEKYVTETTMKNEFMGPFTKFLYHFAGMCACGWGVMIDINERSQRVFLPNHYYKWMHKLKEEIEAELESE